MRGIAPALLRWFDRARRDLPWRRRPSAYRTLVSELMLQQTGVATVVPYFQRFVARFPTLRALAGASDDDVTALWSGLGYYARARNLRRAAGQIVREHAGRMPRTEVELRALPGIGPYTAAAVAAIAFGERAFALDGNGLRVLARLTGDRRPVDAPATRSALHARGLAEVPRARAGDFNQAVMELGALVCTPRNPNCAACPLSRACRAHADGIVDSVPAKKVRTERPRVQVVSACVTDGRQLLLVRRGAGLLRGTWSLPEATATAGAPPAGAARELAERAGLRVHEVAYQGSVRHVFTHRDLTAEVFRVQVARAGEPGADSRWVMPTAVATLGVSTFTRKTLAVGLGALRAPGTKNDIRGLRA